MSQTALLREEATEAWRKAELRPVFDSAEKRDEEFVMEGGKHEDPGGHGVFHQKGFEVDAP